MQASMRKGKNAHLIIDLFPVSTFLVGLWPQSLLLRLNYNNMDFPLQITVIAVFVTISLLHHCGRILAQSSLQHCSLRFLCAAHVVFQSGRGLDFDWVTAALWFFTFRVPGQNVDAKWAQIIPCLKLVWGICADGVCLVFAKHQTENKSLFNHPVLGTWYLFWAKANAMVKCAIWNLSKLSFPSLSKLSGGIPNSRN